MKTTGVSGIQKFGLLDFLGHPSGGSKMLTPRKECSSVYLICVHCAVCNLCSLCNLCSSDVLYI